MYYNLVSFTGDYEGNLYQKVDDNGYVIGYFDSNNNLVDLQPFVTESSVIESDATPPLIFLEILIPLDL